MFVHTTMDTTDLVRISSILIYLSVITPTPAVCLHHDGLRKLFLVSAEIGNQRNAGTRLHMHLLWMKTFTLNAVAFPPAFPFLSYQQWLGIPSWHRQKLFHGRTTKVSISEWFPWKNVVKLGKLHRRGCHIHNAFQFTHFVLSSLCAWGFS